MQNRYSHFQLYGDSANCYSRENFAECEAIADTVDALIAARIGDVTEWEDKATAAELVAQAAANTAIERIEEYKHRAEVAERALLTACVNLIKDVEDNVNMELLAHVVYTKFLRKAEKEIEEERKDG